MQKWNKILALVKSILFWDVYNNDASIPINHVASGFWLNGFFISEESQIPPGIQKSLFSCKLQKTFSWVHGMKAQTLFRDKMLCWISKPHFYIWKVWEPEYRVRSTEKREFDGGTDPVTEGGKKIPLAPRRRTVLERNFKEIRSG